MSRDPVADWLVDDLLWVRRQRGSFQSRLAEAHRLIAHLGGGSLTRARQELERIRREYATQPDSDVTAYFMSCGSGLAGDNLDQRLKAYAKARHVVERTALRRSDRGARLVAQLLRERFAHARPWAYLIVGQRENTLRVFLTFRHEVSSEVHEPAIYVNGSRTEPVGDTATDPDFQQDIRRFRLTPITLDTSVDAETPLVTVAVAWQPEIAPTWELVSSLADDRLYARLTLEPQPLARLEIRWWDEFAASTRDWPLEKGRV